MNKINIIYIFQILYPNAFYIHVACHIDQRQMTDMRSKAKAPKTIPKISVKIWRPIIEKLDKKLDEACLRRDAYLNKVLEVELAFLDEEVSIPNSPAAYSFVANCVDSLDRKLVSLALRPDLVERLNEICSRKRIVRDAFFNRLFLLLAVRPKTIDSLLFQGAANDWCRELWRDIHHDRSFFQSSLYPLATAIDPFWAIRDGLRLYDADAAIETYTEPSSGRAISVQRDDVDSVRPIDSVYATLLELKIEGEISLLGLNCYMPDWRVPGEEAEILLRKKLDELL